MKYGLVIDPGKSTGIVLFSWDEGVPYERNGAWQITGGVVALAGVLSDNTLLGSRLQTGMLDVVIVERFTVRQHEGFNLTNDSVEPLRCEGMLMTHPRVAPLIKWQEPAHQYFMGGENLKERKKRSRDFLRKSGLYLTGKDVSAPDADDAISATLHSIAYMRMLKHDPTIDELFPEVPWI